MALVRCDILSQPNKYGGWDLKNTFHFGKALATKGISNLMKGIGLWKEVITTI